MTTEQIRKALVDTKKISSEYFERVLTTAQSEKVPVESVIIRENLLSEEELGQAIAEVVGYPYVDLNHESIQDDYLEYLPEDVAITQQAIIFHEDDKKFKVATVNPDNFKLIKDLEKVVGKEADVYYAPHAALEKFLLFYKNNLPQDFRDFVLAFQKTKNDDIIVKMVDRLVHYSYENKASDIHIEPNTEDVDIRIRIDGILRKVASYPLELHPKIVFLIKIMSHLRTDEHEMTQDGRFDKTIEGEKFDVRVSILPVTDGENIVMRILAEKSRRLSLEELGLMPEDLEKLKKVVARPSGMVITTGATGSGKTTTLYAILQVVDRERLNVVTIEDPVEYAMDGIQQIQVNEKKKVTFANGLRSIVRQDPDMIMVGEIRDHETATIATNAALTGHVLFSSLHANDTATTFSRFRELGVEKNVIATALSMVISQKLVRKTCPYCKAEHKLTPGEETYLKSNPYFEKVLEDIGEKYGNVKFFKGAGCSMCGNTGHLGRIGLFEVMEVTDAIREIAIKENMLANEIKEVAIANGMKPLQYWEAYHLLIGTTTVDEISHPIA